MRQHSSYLTASEIFDQAVLDAKNRGHNTTVAIEIVAEFFQTSVSKVKKFVYYGDDCSPQERERVHQRYLDHLQAQQDHLHRQLETVKKRLREIS